MFNADIPLRFVCFFLYINGNGFMYFIYNFVLRQPQKKVVNLHCENQNRTLTPSALKYIYKVCRVQVERRH
jgi:hypothetical protein